MKIAAASAYIFGIPALYIILTENRRTNYVRQHGEQAFYMWLVFFAVFFTLRFLINLLWSIKYAPALEIVEMSAVVLMAGYAAFRGIRSWA
ncbi:hypothetical protein ACFL5U_02775 [Candidatus Margulisiibacteriota bacterium]